MRFDANWKARYGDRIWSPENAIAAAKEILVSIVAGANSQ